MKARTFTVIFMFSAITAGAMSLIDNGSFEVPGSSSADTASHWAMNDPDEHGGSWGSASRKDWRSHEGMFIGVIPGTWAEAGTFGGFWQEAEANAGSTYRASGWFWADQAWNAERELLKIEFWNAERTEMVFEQTVDLTDVGEAWTEKSVEATAPENAAWVRIVVDVDKAGTDGALQMDELSLEQTW